MEFFFLEDEEDFGLMVKLRVPMSTDRGHCTAIAEKINDCLFSKLDRTYLTASTNFISSTARTVTFRYIGFSIW